MNEDAKARKEKIMETHGTCIEENEDLRTKISELMEENEKLKATVQALQVSNNEREERASTAEEAAAAGLAASGEAYKDNMRRLATLETEQRNLVCAVRQQELDRWSKDAQADAAAMNEAKKEAEATLERIVGPVRERGTLWVRVAAVSLQDDYRCTPNQHAIGRSAVAICDLIEQEKAPEGVPYRTNTEPVNAELCEKTPGRRYITPELCNASNGGPHLYAVTTGICLHCGLRVRPPRPTMHPMKRRREHHEAFGTLERMMAGHFSGVERAEYGNLVFPLSDKTMDRSLGIEPERPSWWRRLLRRVPR